MIDKVQSFIKLVYDKFVNVLDLININSWNGVVNQVLQQCLKLNPFHFSWLNLLNLCGNPLLILKLHLLILIQKFIKLCNFLCLIKIFYFKWYNLFIQVHKNALFCIIFQVILNIWINFINFICSKFIYLNLPLLIIFFHISLDCYLKLLLTISKLLLVYFELLKGFCTILSH